MILRTPPHSREAEQSVLGALMLSERALDDIGDMVGEGDFFVAAHRLIFRAIRDLAAVGQPCDAVTMAEHFEREGTADQVGGVSYVVSIANATPSAANVRAYATIVRRKAMLRRLIDIGTHLSEQAFGDTDAMTLSDGAIRDLMDLSKSSTSHECSLKDALREALAEIEAAFESGGKLRGIASGIKRLDERLGGFHKGDLVIVGARPAMGKTAFLFGLADSAAEAGHAVGVISGEQPRMQMGQRLISRNSAVPAECLRNGKLADEHWPRITGAVARMHGRNVMIYDRSAPTIDEVCRVARKWKSLHSIAALYVDYVQRIRVPGADRIEEVSEVGRSLKDLARDLDIPVIALAQVKAAVEQRADKRPMQGDLANSDELTREADIIAMLYRDEVYNENTSDRGIAEINVEKNRHGPLGMIRAYWDGKTMRFDNLAEAVDYGVAA